MRLFILSQCRDLRTGVMKEDFGVLVTQHEQESSGCSGVFLSETAVISGLIDLDSCRNGILCYWRCRL